VQIDFGTTGVFKRQSTGPASSREHRFNRILSDNDFMQQALSPVCQLRPLFSNCVLPQLVPAFSDPSGADVVPACFEAYRKYLSGYVRYRTERGVTWIDDLKGGGYRSLLE
jgi:hypothetical protein